MVSYIRRQEIMKFLKERHFSTVGELSRAVYASESSVRRDLKSLEEAGLLRLIYGGVVLPEYENTVVPVSVRDASNPDAKSAVAKKAAQLVSDGDTLFMDGSSTVRRVLKYLAGRKNLKIITNNLRIFKEGLSGAELYCTGGRFVPQSSIFTGSAAEEYIKNINADIVFFSSQGVSEDGTVSDVSEEETALRKVMLSNAKKKVFLCDSSKIGVVKTFVLCRKEDVDVFVCDKPLPWE